MTKSKWLFTELPLPLRDLSKLMLDIQYTEEKGIGFLLSTSTSSNLSGRYIERLVTTTIVEDPFGEKSEVKSIYYYICKFSWQANSKLLCIIEPPRSLRKFINKLHEMIGLGVVVAELPIEPDRCLGKIKANAKDLIVTNISCYGIRTAHEGLAKISITGKKDVRQDLLTLIGNKKHKFDNVKFVVEYEGNMKVTAELTKSGVCRFQSNATNFFLQELRTCIEDSISY